MTHIVEKDAKTMGHLMIIVAKVAKQLGLVNGYRTVINNGKDANQTVQGLLIHVIGGEQLQQPPDNKLLKEANEDKTSKEKVPKKIDNEIQDKLKK